MRRRIPLKLGLQTYSLHLAFGLHPDCRHYPDKLSLGECIDKAAGWGFTALQIDPVHLEDDSSSYGAMLKKRAEDAGIKLELGVGGFDAEHVLNKLRFAEAIDAEFIRIFADTGARETDKTTLEESKKYIEENVKKVLPELEKRGITLGWENHGDFSTDEQLAVLKNIDHPNFRSCLDIGNALVFIEQPMDTVKKLAAYAGGVHFKDYNVSSATFGVMFYGTALGSGFLPLKEITAYLQQHTDIEHLIYEQSIAPVSDDPVESKAYEEETVRKSIAYARNELGVEI
jgi:sugar phosphate isomerase/epimerase